MILIGIDGGGTKTDCFAADENLNILYECSGGSANLLIDGEKHVAELLFGLIKNYTEKLEINFNDISSIVIGCKGAGRIDDAKKLNDAIMIEAERNNAKLNKLLVTSDAAIALQGAFSGNPGCILISGTGSILFCKDKTNNLHRVGGYGKLIGDEGSAYSIGRKALSAAAKQFDNRGSTTLITDLLKEKYNIDSSEKLISAVYNKSLDIASIAMLVISSAESDDLVAKEILAEECDELILHMLAIKDTLNPFNICLMGGNLNSENYFSRLLIYKINSELPFVNIKTPDYPPAIGAILLGIKL